MDERFVKRLLVPSCVIVALSTAFIYELKYLIDILFFKKKHILIIGILSAPENFQQRLSIRKTWLQLLSEISGSAYFIIGNEICAIPPYDRVDPYTCEDKPFVLPMNATTQTEFTTMAIQNRNCKPHTPIPGFIGFSFYVRSSIIVKKLGILKELLLVLNKEIQVKLVSAHDNKILGSVTFNSDLLNESTSPFITKAIKPVTLNTQFEAFIKLETKNIRHTYFPNCDFAMWEDEPNVINFIQLWQENSVIPQPFTKKSCTFLHMNYSILDIENIKQQSNNRTLRLKEWNRFKRKLSLKLNSENQIYNDLLFVDVVDVYRNLSMKMMQFYKRITESEYFHYVLKTDDDSFIDLVRVHNQLMTVNRDIDHEISQSVGQVKETGILAKLRFSKLWWWSFFKEFWKVERAGTIPGKWRENQYKSASYPIFPCGGGYVVNKGIVDYIARNDRYLHHFQGEDVSLGIWLSPLPVTQYKTPKVIPERESYYLQKKIIIRFNGKRYWVQFKMNQTLSKLASNLCEWTCTKQKSSNIPLCNKVQLSIPNMYATWNEFISKGFL